MKLIVTSLCLLIAFTNASLAASSGWVNGHQIERVFKQIDRNNMIPVNIQCRWGSGVGQNRKNTLLKVEYVPNQYQQQWRWAWGDRVTPTDRRYQQQGYRKISSAAFIRSSGLKIDCAIWHR